MARVQQFNEDTTRVQARYWDSVHVTPFWKSIHREENDVLAEMLAPREGELILDIGCRFGGRIKKLKASAAAFIGIDISRFALRRARDSFKDHSRIQFVNQDACRLAFRERLFDKIYSAHLLEHVDVEALLGEIKRVLRPGGRLVVIVPNEGSRIYMRAERLSSRICTYLTRFFPYRPRVPFREYQEKMREVEERFRLSQHINEFNRNKLRRLLAGSGFTVESVRGLGIPNFFGIYTYHSRRISRGLLFLKKVISALPIVSGRLARSIIIQARLKDEA